MTIAAPSFAAVADILVEPIGAVWAAYSPASGETLLLNDESAAILEILRDGPANAHSVCTALAEDSGRPAEDWAPMLDAHWPQLINAGLVRQLADTTTHPA